MISKIKSIYLKKFFIIILFVLGTLELFRFGWKFTTFSNPDFVFPPTPATEFLQNQEYPFRVVTSTEFMMPANLHIPYKIDFSGGYETIRPFRNSKFLGVVNSGKPDAHPATRYGIVEEDTSPLLNLVNTKYVLALKEDAEGKPSLNGNIPERFNTQKYQKVFEDKTTVILKNLEALERAFVVYDWEVVEDDQKTLERLADPNYDYRGKILLAKDTKPSLSLENSFKDDEAFKSDGISKVDYLEKNGQRVLINVETDKSGLLFVSDSYYPGWEAYVDGEEREILRADYNFRAVYVPKGKHEVEFIYKPRSFANGIILSFVSLSLLFAISFYLTIFGKKSR